MKPVLHRGIRSRSKSGSVLAGFQSIVKNPSSAMTIILFFIFLSFGTQISADFNPDFRTFIHNSFGIGILTQLERKDLGPDASFGGKNVASEPLKHQAVIIVHGITNKITRFLGLVNALQKRGYTNGEIYGTTWGDAGATPIGLVDMKCSYIKQIRAMIIAVRQYTGTKVDIVAYSMGSPIARKAILGGNCVDTREILGPPLTELIDTFLSVAGSNHGSSLCFVPIPVGTCNKRTGLHCESEFLADINGQTKYEGTFIFSIFSSGDDKIGFRNGCGKLTSPIIGETGYIKRDGLNHDQIMDTTYDMQINFITKHHPKA